MNFLHPAILFGVASVAVPIAIHLIHKLRIRETRWAAMRFLEETMQRVQRRLRWEDFLLLLLRCLLFAVLAVAFARPVRQTFIAGDGFPNGPVAAVVLLDNSASMGQSDGAQTRFDAAKKAARAFVDKLQPGSQVALALVSNRAEPLIGKPTGDFALIRRALELAPMGNHGSDLEPGVRAALQILQPLAGRAREIVIFTDGQAEAWSHLEEIRALQKEAPGIRIKPVILGARGEENLSVNAVQVDGNIPAINQPARFRIEVTNHGTQAAEGVRVTLSVDGGAPSDETFIPRIEAGASQWVSLFARFATSGAHGVTAKIPPDRLAVDNERSAVVTVASQRNALILESNNTAPNKADRDGFFLANALAPVPRDRLAQHYLKVSSAPYGLLNGANLKEKLANVDFLFLCNPSDVAVPAAEALRDYVRGGGRLVIFPGSKTDPAKWGQNPALAALLPAALQPKPAPSAPLAFQASGYQHPVTALWNDPAQGTLSSVRFDAYYPLNVPPATDSGEGRVSVLVHFANGEPAVVEKPLGLGRVVLFSSAATPQGNNFPLHPAFVPFVQRLLGFLDPRRTAKLTLEPGARFETAVPMEFMGRDFSVIAPGKETAHTAGKVEPLDGQPALRFSDTEAPGIYRLLAEETPIATFAVQLPATESDLRQADRKAIEALAEAPTANADKNRPTTVTATRAVITKEYWTPLLWLAAALALAEMLLAHRITPGGAKR